MRAENLYRTVDNVPDFPAMERRILEFWRDTDTFRKLREKNAGKEPWSFLDGPITANNPMGVHHAWGRSYKDMFCRYHAMNGRDLRFQNGFDCQGLWVEVEVEKELGFKTKADIRDYGIDRFVARCKERVLKFAARQTEQSIRLGHWMDWDDPATLLRLRDALRDGRENVEITAPSGRAVHGSPEKVIGRLGSADWGGSYFTFSDENNYTIWNFLKKCHDEGFVYRGTDVMPWCCRCGTGLSQMEVAEGRRITAHPSVFVRFPLRDRDREALLVWTTTPWTLTSNVAAAVHPELIYLRVRHGGWVYYLAKTRFEEASARQLDVGGVHETHKMPALRAMLERTGTVEVIGEVRGQELLGAAYLGPFDHLEAQRRPGGVNPYARPGDGAQTAVECHRVIGWKEVSDAEGSGIVHIAPGCGAEDQQLGRDHGLVAVAPLEESGQFVAGFGEFTGRHVFEVNAAIVEDLKARNLLVAKEGYRHVYPHCWRCKEELVFRLVAEWFIRMEWRDRIQRIVSDIRWIPPDGEAREQDWLANMGDWMISKKRFWGLALPIWACNACDWFTVVGGEADLRERAVEGWDAFAGHSPHRPWIDAVKLRCERCGALASRIEEVGNPWLDAGIVPFSTLHYGTDHDYWSRWFPADFVVECFPGQFRNWFYSLLSMSAMLSGRAPFKVLLGHALVLDARGEEMHKSTGNAIAFDDAAEVLGAEIMRYLYASQNPVQNLAFPDLPVGEERSKGSIDGEVRRKLLTLWNCYSFFVTYASVDSWTPPRDRTAMTARSELDRWIMSRLMRLVGDAHDEFANFSLHRLIERFEHFVDDLSNWYLRRSRRRFWKSGSDSDKEHAYQTLYEVLTTLVRLMAPILPFLSEEIWQNLVRSTNPASPGSVHLTDYPQVDHSLIEKDLEAQIECVIRIKNIALGLRNRAKVRARQPLGRLFVRPRDEADRAVLSTQHLRAQILDECNVKGIELIEDEQTLVRIEARPDFKALGPRHGKHLKTIASHLAGVRPTDLRRALDRGSYRLEADGTEIELFPGDVELRMHSPPHLVATDEHGTFAALDTTITQDLLEEGLARDFNRQVQDHRKTMGLSVSDRIRVRYFAPARIGAAILAHRAWLEQELLADAVEPGVSATDVRVQIDGDAVCLAIERA